MNRNFRDMFDAQWTSGKIVSVGLDSEFDKIPRSARRGSVSDTIFFFNASIVDATKDLVCAYKPNIALYSGLGAEAMQALKETISYIHASAPLVPVILDSKRADIGNTNLGYVREAFGFLDADAITVNPYFGAEALRPFLDQKNKGVFVLCCTSNLGSNEFQGLDVCGDTVPGCYMPFYKYVAHRVANYWDKNGNCGLVVGATYPEELREVRRMALDMPILIPGIGAQGGDVEKTVTAGRGGPRQQMIINASRSIIFASNGPDFAEAARRETEKLHNLINQFRK